MYRRLIALSSALAMVLFLLNTAANLFYWYSSIYWFDMLMHCLGGVFVAVLGGAVLRKEKTGLTPRELFITLMLFVFVVGLSWEYYEYIVQFYIKNVELASVDDSVSDLICDMIGALIGFYFVILVKKRYNK